MTIVNDYSSGSHILRNDVTITGVLTANGGISIPNNGGASIRPSLLLDFANSKTMDSRVTFTRASTATYTDYDGLVKIAASGIPRFDFNPTTGESLGLLIEEQRTNLLTYSENLENRNIVRAMVVSNATTAPDGTITADKLVANTTNGDHFAATGALSGTSSSTIYTVSCYVKAAELYRLTLDICDSSDYITTRLRGDFNLNAVTGTVTVGTGTCAIVPVGNSWYRISVSGAAKAGSSAVVECIITLMNNSGQLSFVGNNIDGIYIWGAQLEAGSFPTSYIPSADSFTSRASAGSFIGSNGLIQSAATNVARYNYNPLNLALAPKLLLEPAATNLLTYSEDFTSGAWTINAANVSVTANQIVSPDGATTADKIQTTLASTNNTGYVHQSVTVTANRAYNTYSVYVKKGSVSIVTLNLMNGSPFTQAVMTYNFDTNVITSTDTVFPQCSATNVGNGWFRLSLTLAGNASTGVACRIYVRDQGTNNTTSDYVYAWGAQFEENSPSATSYIQTTSATVTRAADVSSSAQATRAADNAVMTGTNFSSWYRQDEGTVLLKLDTPLNTNSFIATIDRGLGTYGPRIQLSAISSGVGYYVVDDAGNTPVTLSKLGFNAVAFTYKLNDFAISALGQAVSTDNSGTLPSAMAALLIGKSPISTQYLGGHIAKLAYYPKRLSNAELQSITGV